MSTRNYSTYKEPSLTEIYSAQDNTGNYDSNFVNAVVDTYAAVATNTV
jgi:hypothetical protein